MARIEIVGDRCVDISHLIEFDMPRAFGFPDIEKYWMHRVSEGSLVNVERVTTVLHVGTHVDAPRHFFDDGATIDQFPAECLTGPAVVIDQRSKFGHGGTTREDIIAWEKETGETINPGDAVILMTNHSKLWRLGETDPEFLRVYPYLSEDGAKYLVEKGVRMACTEAADIDDVDRPEGPSHRVLLGNNIFIIENVCNLEAIGANRCQIMALPLKIKDGTGSMLRMVAVV